MADTTKPPAATPLATNEDEEDHKIGGDDIAKLLQSEGPVVSCVVLRAAKQLGQVSSAEANAEEDQSSNNELPVEELVEELEIDTTPAKNEVEKILGGPITFIGQYDQGEGIVLMALRGFVSDVEEDGTDLSNMTIRQLKAKCLAWNICTNTMTEKKELVDALRQKEATLLPINPHKLQPPLHNIRVRGDILILKVAEVDDNSEEGDYPTGDADENGNDNENADQQENDNVNDETKVEPKGDTKEAERQSSDETGFFLPYTKEEYLKFAARTDIVAQPLAKGQEADDEEEEEDDAKNDDADNGNDNDHDEDFQPGEDMDFEELTEEEEKSAMLNIVMSELLRKFRSDNGRGAASREVLEIRASVAEQIGIDVVTYDESQDSTGTSEEQAKEAGQKRNAEEKAAEPAKKKVKFDESTLDTEESALNDEEASSEKISATNAATSTTAKEDQSDDKQPD